MNSVEMIFTLLLDRRHFVLRAYFDDNGKKMNT